MKKTIIALLACILLSGCSGVSTSQAAYTLYSIVDSFDFNTASAAEMVAICKSQHITLPLAVADNIVAYREANGPFKTEDDLAKVEGFTPQLIMQLYPREYDNSLWFDPSYDSHWHTFY